MVSCWKFLLYRQFHTFLRKFHTLLYTFFKRFFALKVFSFIPNFYKKFRKIKWIIPEIRFKKANRGYLLTIFCHFWTKRFSSQNQAQSLFRIHWDISSCQKSEKFNEPIFWKTPGHTHRQTHKGQSIGPYLQRRWVQ